jgi:sec-independent protein translocase protein TatB
MFDFSEILIIFALALVVLGPKKLPGAAAQIGKWLGRARAMARQFREQLEEEVNSVKDLDTPRRPPPPVYTPPPSYTPPAPSTTQDDTMTHPTPTESPSEWLAQSGTAGAAETPPEVGASAPADSPPAHGTPTENASTAGARPPPAATRFAHEDPQTNDLSEHERGS